MQYICPTLISGFGLPKANIFADDPEQNPLPKKMKEQILGGQMKKAFAEKILLEQDYIFDDKKILTVCDQACGTGGMLSVAEEYLHELNAATELMSFGQEINDQTFAICKADMLIKGNNADFIKNGNTLSDDQFEGQTFDYIISNPPFGREWKNEKAKVEAEAKKGFGGRFGAGLPAASDGQMLFLMTALSKMKDAKDGGSRIAIIHNGSPLFTGDAGSGPSDIRKYILENDLLEAIVALPNDIFYNTGIATYIWVLSNKKEGTKREGKVQLINANGLFEKRRKALGNKRNDITEEQIAEITKTYGEFRISEISQIYDNADFGYTKITVERPLYDENGIEAQTDNRRVTVRVTGEGVFRCLDTGDLRREGSFAGNSIKTYFGKALIVVQSTRKVGEMQVEVEVEGFDKPFILPIYTEQL